MNIDTSKVIVIENKFAKLRSKLESRHNNVFDELSRCNGHGSDGRLIHAADIKADANYSVLCELLELLDECVTDSGKAVE